MVDKRQVITVCSIVVIVIAMVLGINSISGITGNTITGSVVDEAPVIKDEYFRIDDFGMRINETEEINDTQNKSG